MRRKELSIAKHDSPIEDAPRSRTSLLQPYNEELNVGTYTTQWNAHDLASGVYLYRLQTGDFVDTKKLLLLK